MIVFSIGLPSQFAVWCDRLITKLMSLGGATADATEANSLEEVAAGAIRSTATHLVVRARQPSNRLQSEILQTGHPFVVAVSDPRTVVYRLLAAGQDLAAATRLVANSCSGMRTLTTALNALVVSEAANADPIETAKAVADHLGLRASAYEVLSLVRELANEGVGPGGDDAAVPEGADERARATVDGAVLPYIAHLAGGELAPLVWERELFYLFEDPPSAEMIRATRPVDLTGRPRVLIYGPSIRLPPGNWCANVVLAFSAETAGNGFTLDVYAGQQLAQVRADSTGEHVVDVALHFVVPPTLELPIEVRLLSERAAFEGQVALGQVTVRPEKDIDAGVKERLTQMLHTEASEQEPDQGPVKAA